MADNRKNRKKNKKRRHYALLMLLTASVAFMTLWSFIQLPRAYASYVYEPLSSPVIAVTMQGIHDGVYPWGGALRKTSDEEPVITDTDASDTGESSSDTGAASAADQNAQSGPADIIPGGSAEGAADSDAGADTVGKTVTDANADASNGADTGADGAATSSADDTALSADENTGLEDTTAEDIEDNTPKSYVPVDDDYFTDALFVGDSRMDGLSQYCEPLDTRADFYVKRALTIYNLRDGKPIKSFDGTQKTLWEVLDAKQYGKIYIMVGINEIGVGNSEYFKDAYAEVVDRIREVQPDALIFINSIMHVSQSKSDNDSLYNNTNINARNDAIATLADNIHIFYLNVNEAVDDENGALKSDITFDDIHLKGSCYEPWHEYLLSHGIR